MVERKTRGDKYMQNMKITIKSDLYLELCLIIRDEIVMLEEKEVKDTEGIKMYYQILKALTKNNEAWLMEMTNNTFFFPLKQLVKRK